MSKDDDSKKPGPEDDGWGDAADNTPEEPKPIAPVADADPVDIENRVAALHAKGSTGAQSASLPASEPPTARPPSSRMPDSAIPASTAGPASTADSAASTQQTASTADSASGKSQSDALSGELPSSQQTTGTVDSAPEEAPTLDDAPQWKSEDVAALPSDMMAVAEVLAEKEKLHCKKTS